MSIISIIALVVIIICAGVIAFCFMRAAQAMDNGGEEHFVHESNHINYIKDMKGKFFFSKVLGAVLAIAGVATGQSVVGAVLAIAGTATAQSVYAETTVDIGNHILFSGFHVTNGVNGGSGYEPDEGYDKVVDGNRETSWIFGSKPDCNWVEFYCDASFIPKGFIITTYQEIMKHPLWSLYSFRLSGRMEPGDFEGWVTLYESGWPPAHENFIDVKYEMEENTAPYKYFRFELFEAIDQGIQALNEIQIYGDLYSEHRDATPSNCFSDGNIEYWWRSDDTYYTDEGLTHQVSKDQTLIRTPGHAVRADGICTVCQGIPQITDIKSVSSMSIYAVNADEDYDKVMDGNPATKWCTKTTTPNDYMFFKFTTEEPVFPDHFSFTTGNDVENHPNRNPKNCIFYGLGMESNEWEVIANFGDELPATNTTEVSIPFSVQDKAYTQFRLTMEFQDEKEEDTYIMEVGELKIWGKYKHRGVVVEHINGKTMVTFDDGSEIPVSIPAELTADKVVLNRNFFPGRESALYLPFDITEDMGDIGAELYQFDRVDNEDGRWIVTVRRTRTLAANTPCFIIPDKVNLTFDTKEGPFILNTVDKEPPTKNGWSIVGTYMKKTWDGDSDDYGYSAAQPDSYKKGIMSKMSAGDYILPLRSYVSYAGERSSAAEVKARRTEGNSPDYIEIRFVDEEGNPTNLVAPVINGNPIRDGWYTLDGKRLPNAPHARGIYIYNEKKVLVP